MIVNDFPLNSEYWRVIDGFPNYDVSTDGRVRTIKTGNIMKSYLRPTGYIQVSLSKDKKASSHRVHRLVATAFCIKTDGCDIVDHLDRNPSNNNYQNLRWTTLSGNGRNKSIAINNASGTSGVYYVNNRNEWIASWCNKDMKRRCKSFSVNKYGDVQAKQKAVDYRKQMEEENDYFNV